MPKVTSAVTNFTSGEFSPLSIGRFGIDRYFSGAKKIVNFLIHNVGGLIRRPGSKFVAEVKFSNKETRLIDFKFSTDQAYALEFGDIYTRFFTDQGQVQTTTHAITGATQANPCVITSVDHPFQDGDTVTPSVIVGMTELNGNPYTVANRTADTYELVVDSTLFTAYTSGGISTRSGATEIPTSYVDSKVFGLQFAQSFDVMYFVVKAVKVMKLSRLSATSWTMTEVEFVRGPFLDVNITATTITPSSDTGATTLTATTSIFESGHIGSLWRVKDGVVKITGFTSGTVINGNVQAEPDGSVGNLNTGVGAVTDWAEGAWSDVRGYPTSVTFHEQRLVFGKDQTVFASVVQSFENFNKGSKADSDAFTYLIGSEQSNSIRWFSSGPKSLQVGTAGGTFSFSSGSTNVPITPSAILVSRDTTYGAASILPKRIGSFVYFVQRNLKLIRELGFNFDVDSQVALDMTLLSDHVNNDGVVDMAYQQAPNDTMWCATSNGEMSTLTRQIDQNVIGWSRQISGSDSVGPGKYKSVISLPLEESDDEVWSIVQREINGSTVKYVEYFTSRSFVKQDDAFYVDAGLSLDNPLVITGATQADPVVITSNMHGRSNGDQIKIVDIVGPTPLNDQFFLVANKTANTLELTNLSGVDIDGTGHDAYVSGGEMREMVSTITGLTHLEGETVAVAADGGALPDAVVSSGQITLSLKVAKAHVGLPYLPFARGLPLVDGSAKGTGAGQVRSMYKAIGRFYRTVGGRFGFEGDTFPILFKKGGGFLNTAPDLFTGLKEFDFPSAWDREKEWYIEQPQPLPMNILSIVVLSDVSDE